MVLDQIEAAKYLGSLKFVDPSRIEFLAGPMVDIYNNLIKNNRCKMLKLASCCSCYKLRYYDSVYTERYNGLPKTMLMDMIKFAY